MTRVLIVAFTILMATALDASGQTLATDPSRDLALHTPVQAFLNSTITAARLETDLHSYAREFEASPYKVGVANIDWPKLPQDVLFAFARVVSRITHVAEQRISPGFLSAMGTQFITGRDFAPSDDERSMLVAIVNESFARRFLQGRSPLGARFFREGPRAGELMEVVGVVRDSKWSNLREEPRAMYYRPYRQMGGIPVVRFALRTSGDPNAVAPLLIQAAQSIDRRMAIRNAVPFREIVNRTLVIERLVGYVSAAFAALAMLTAAVGLYGVLAYSVVRRRREIGVRIAIGAQPGAVEWMIVRESLVLLACGVALGVPASMMITRLVSSLLFGLSPRDPGTIVAVLTVLPMATIAAAYVPAKRAARIDPVFALREE